MPDRDDAEGSIGLARNAARRLRRAILDLDSGTRLGSEEDIRSRFEISRPILRQAARILEHEQLLDVRRGVGGGYYTRQPSIKAVARAAATYLQAHDATMSDNVRIAQVFAIEIGRLAALSPDAAAHARLALLRDAIAIPAAPHYTPAVLLEHEAALMEALVQLADTPTLGLFQRILHEFGRQDRRHHIYRGRPDRCAEWRRQRLMLIDAVLAHDGEMAALLARRQNELSQSWLEADDTAEAVDAETRNGEA